MKKKTNKTRRLSISSKIALGIAVTLLGLVAILEFITYAAFNKSMDQEYQNNAMSLAKAVSLTLDKSSTVALINEVMNIYNSVENKVGTQNAGSDEYNEYIANFQSIEQSPNYYRFSEHLNDIRQCYLAESLYIICIDAVNKKSVYIVDGSSEPCHPGDFDPLFEMNYGILDNPEAGFPPYTTITPEYGWLVSAGAPFYDEEGNVVAYIFVDLNESAVKKVINKFIFAFIVLGLVIAVFVCLIYLAVVKRNLIMPINKLSDAALSYNENAEGEVFANLKIKTGDEIENLASAMKRMEQDIKEYIANITSITAERERIGAELNVATQIQSDMLPKIFPKFADKKEYEVFASMNPAKEVGGDFYDVFEIDETHLGLVVADVSGKGVPAALFMVIAKTLIKNRAMVGGSPSEVLEYANDQLCEGNDAGYFVTVWLAIVDITTGKGIAANAGHEHPAIRRAGGQFELSIYKHSMAVGTFEGLKFKEHEFQLEHGDTLFCYTDGVTEATDANNELFGNDRLIEALNTADDSTVENLCKSVKKSIDDFVGEAPQFDDITMLGFKFF